MALPPGMDDSALQQLRAALQNGGGVDPGTGLPMATTGEGSLPNGGIGPTVPLTGAPSPAPATSDPTTPTAPATPFNRDAFMNAWMGSTGPYATFAAQHPDLVNGITSNGKDIFTLPTGEVMDLLSNYDPSGASQNAYGAANGHAWGGVGMVNGSGGINYFNNPSASPAANGAALPGLSGGLNGALTGNPYTAIQAALGGIGANAGSTLQQLIAQLTGGSSGGG